MLVGVDVFNDFSGMFRFIPTLIFSCWALALTAQNIVPNPGFENNSGCPGSSCEWFLADDWTNVSGSLACNVSAGTPDYYANCGSGFFTFPFTLNGEVSPFNGNAVMGISTWLSFSCDAREYLSVPLSATMQAGTTYDVSLYYTNGDFNPAVSYGGYGTELDLHFSNGPLTQTANNPILLTPSLTTGSAIFSTTWQQLTFTYTPAVDQNYLTIGNFRNDLNVTTILFNAATGLGYAYYFLDDISITPSPVLPVEWTDWRVRNEKERVQLSFLPGGNDVITDIVAERSPDGRNFSPINSEMQHLGDGSFAWTDELPLAGQSVYRLKLQLLDGSLVFSPM
ncbi:MAG: hypothetical protein AAF206_31035, partial [Bacteroidota bacterium]